jgi:hypothetical protein
LDSLEITNFRAFPHLVIPQLGRVNLITGKNNVGKTSLLEAVCIWGSQGREPNVLYGILARRKEIDYNNLPRTSHPLKYLFHSWEAEENSGTTLNIQSTIPLIGGAVTIVIRENGEALLYNRDKIGDPISHYEPLTSVEAFEDALLKSKIVFVSPNGMSNTWLLDSWGRAELTPAEDTAIGAMQIMEKRIRDIAIKPLRTNPTLLTLWARVEGFNEPIPLESLGDGINRLFGLALAVGNARDGMLLIDEIENGIHYSVLPQIWRFLFQLARRHNVQVFATTHSWDCIEAFQQAASEDEDPQSGVLVRLTRQGEDIVSTIFDERRLAIVTRDGIEVR